MSVVGVPPIPEDFGIRSELRQVVAASMGDVLVDAHFPQIPGYVPGKVRDNYDLADGRRRILVTTDRQSAFDQVLAAVPFKGQVLTATARFWFDATRDIIANHVLAYPDPNVMVARRLAMLPVEIVVREYMTGSTATSIWPMYQAGSRTMYGCTFADGLRKNERLPAAILTPTTKGVVGVHDVPVTPADLIASGKLSAAQWDELASVSLLLFARGRALAAERGLILVDTKYEFGIGDNGDLVLADEVHTPDSSRYWRADSYDARFAAAQEPESLDKDFLRRWIVARCDPYREPIPPIPADTLVEFALRYIALYETLTGEILAISPPASPIRDRVRTNVLGYLQQDPPTGA
ncbi:MAG: phosphoribosylaminoimidazolesuccinocarboxamide synthase [Rhodospirillales bacterium]